ncbi:hypothetical protein [Sphingomonas sp. PP-CC-3A-396]|uniref:hypothetical protein n=1 Tax=Sphingomonas sp. PP-CC-3A-396 TaxID=2135655 RepID=UPI001047B322|nr:hypothetical protein [Sphingomonas sp. PP-CC-3A-396]
MRRPSRRAALRYGASVMAGGIEVASIPTLNSDLDPISRGDLQYNYGFKHCLAISSDLNR